MGAVTLVARGGLAHALQPKAIVALDFNAGDALGGGAGGQEDLGVVAAVGLTLGGCASHAYSLPVVTTVQTSSGQADVAWVVEDGIRIVRCVNGPDRPVCRRATVD